MPPCSQRAKTAKASWSIFRLSVPGEKVLGSWERVAKRREWVVRRWVGRVIGRREEVQRIVIWEGWVGRS